MRTVSTVVTALLLMSGNAVAQQSPNTPSNAGANNTIGSERTDPNTPKTYQPQNPAPDTRVPPTGSATGKGAESGGHPEAGGLKK
jgi:hypothetical protein